MTTTTVTPYRSAQSAGRDGFWSVLRAEWTKFRTLRGWLLAALVAAALMAVLPVYLAAAAHGGSVESCTATGCQIEGSSVAVGPGGVAVLDSFYLVHQSLSGNGSITAKVTAPTGMGLLPKPKPGSPILPKTQPWAKAGIIIKTSTAAGSAYAAVMLTGSHGVRMQYDYTHDVAGPGGKAAPLWLRLTRSGPSLTGYESADGTHWTKIGTATLPDLPATVQGGMFVASPAAQVVNESFGGGDNMGVFPTAATAAFSHLRLAGGWSAAAWTGSRIGGAIVSPDSPPVARPGGHSLVHVCKTCGGTVPEGYRQTPAGFDVEGSGDIAPFVPIVDAVQVSLDGILFGLIAMISLGALYVTAEYRRGMIRTTLAASPHRSRVLAAKAIVIGLVCFAAGLIGAAIAFPILEDKLQAGGWTGPAWPHWSLTSGIGLQVVIGTAAIVGLSGILALAAGVITRRSSGAVAAVIGLVIVPLILGIVLPPRVADVILAITPAAAFSLQRALPRYTQVSNACAPYHGCFPLAPWTGLAVMCAWAVLGLGLASYLLRRRDA